LNTGVEDTKSMAYGLRLPHRVPVPRSKQFTGLTACQVRTATALHNHFNASLTVVSCAKLGTHPMAPGAPVPFLMANLKRRYLNQSLPDWTT
jgi:hypothetical protein